MRTSEILRSVIANILSNKFRVFLTTLGIIVGSATIVLVISIGVGGQKSVEEQFARLNADIITVMAGRNTVTQISPEDLEYIEEKSTLLKNSEIFLQGNVTASSSYEEFSGGALGVNESFIELNNFEMASGYFIEEEDVSRRQKVVTIGSEVALTLYGDASSAIGETLTISGRRYEIIGVLEANGKMVGFSSADEAIFFPYTTYESYITGKNLKPALMLQAYSVDETKLLYEDVINILNLKYMSSGGNPFMIRDAGSALTAAEDSAKMMTVLLTSVAVIVLIVGGIGIMNVLFVSVKERTKEIGILKALGAKRKIILLIFLFESIAISIIGAVVGIGLSFVIMPLMKYTGIPAIPSASAYIVAVVFALFTGTFFGYYPALSASKLKPIDALRYE
ncbi:ABC transporter permease [Clostridiaceae bacterium HSG29]|nr:ABC transporter permease [Clostridiaceae bacterium HSG29]